jgi:hypothetical protein
MSTKPFVDPRHVVFELATNHPESRVANEDYQFLWMAVVGTALVNITSYHVRHC